MYAELKTDLLSLVPGLRAFAFCLVQDFRQADELVCSSLVAIWSGNREKKCVDLKVTAFGTLYRQFLRQGSVEFIPATAFNKRPLPPADDAFASQFMRLPWTERVAVSLTEAWGFTLDEAACICDCERETITCRAAAACRHLRGRSSPSPAGKTATQDAGNTRVLREPVAADVRSTRTLTNLSSAARIRCFEAKLPDRLVKDMDDADAYRRGRSWRRTPMRH